jgi:crotonobetainyl-CoA:carnitine CoA-transferase CaiB-like acyl-CoA transferase
VRWPGPDVGAHTTEILEEFLGLSAERSAELSKQGVV